jgi:DUF4097 and DUF4098 domain-containing protein YvlB
MRVFNIAIILISLILIAGCEGNYAINDNVTIAENEQVKGDVATVNGAIKIGSNAVVDGDCRTVNGKISLANGVETGSLMTVNGQITVGKKCTVNGEIATVNGKIVVGDSSRVFGRLGIVNGDIQVSGAWIKSNIESVNGDIYVSNRSVIQGSIELDDVDNATSQSRKVVIEGGSIVKGNVINQDADYTTLIYVSPDSKVEGEIKGCRIVRDKKELN